MKSSESEPLLLPLNLISSSCSFSFYLYQLISFLYLPPLSSLLFLSFRTPLFPSPPMWMCLVAFVPPRGRFITAFKRRDHNPSSPFSSQPLDNLRTQPHLEIEKNNMKKKGFDRTRGRKEGERGIIGTSFLSFFFLFTLKLWLWL